MTFFDDQLLLKRLAHYSGPAEVHITVSLENTSGDKARFQRACQQHNGKSIWIELESGETVNQPMYGARLFTSAQEQADEIKMLVCSFAQDFHVRRVKVEAGPHNQNIPQSSQDALDAPDDCYFEHHVALRLNSIEDLDKLKSDLKGYHGYLSKNAFKTTPESGEHIRFVTQRFSNIGQQQANIELEKLTTFVKQQEINVRRVEREYNIFDSNLHLDQGWMS